MLWFGKIFVVIIIISVLFGSISELLHYFMIELVYYLIYVVDIFLIYLLELHRNHQVVVVFGLAYQIFHSAISIQFVDHFE